MKVNCLNDSFSDLAIVALDLAMTLKWPCMTLDDLAHIFLDFSSTFTWETLKNVYEHEKLND